MKYLLSLLFFATTVHAEANWTMVKHSTPLCYYVDFHYLQEEIVTDTVTRSGLFTPRYYYDLYGADGTFLARAKSRAFSLGLLATSQMEFDIYDGMGSYMGYIGGKLWTSGKAKFGFMDANGNTTGFALLNSDADAAKFSILSSDHAIVGTLNGALSGDLSQWEFNPKKSFDIDMRTIKLFTAFASDFHSFFIRKPPTPIIIHYENHRNR